MFEQTQIALMALLIKIARSNINQICCDAMRVFE